MFDSKCPGAANVRGTPTLKVKKCPECNEEIEVFSGDVSATCKGCGFTIYEEVQSCIQWCKYAEQCVGEEVYKKFKKKE